MNPATLACLAAFPDVLETHYAIIPAQFVNWAPLSWDGIPSERFTAVEHLCHLRDVEIEGYHVRFRRLLDEVNPTLVPLDSEAIARERHYATSGSEAVFRAFRAARRETVGWVSRLSADQLAREGVYGRHGPVRVSSLVHLLCAHDQQHLAGLHWLLGKIEGAHALSL